MAVMVFGSLTKDFLHFYFSVFSSVLVSIEKMYQTLETVFDYTLKHLEIFTLYVVFSTLYAMFGNVVKQGLLYLIYHSQCSLA